MAVFFLCSRPLGWKDRMGWDGMVYLPDDVRVVLFLPESEISGAGEKVVVVSPVLLYPFFSL